MSVVQQILQWLGLYHSSPPAPTATPKKNYLSVHVQDATGKGIANAVVRVVDSAPNPNAGASITTNSNGDTPGWLLNAPAGFTIVVNANNYVTPQGVGVTLNGTDVNVTITLKSAHRPISKLNLQSNAPYLKLDDGSVFRYRFVTCMDAGARTTDEQTALLDAQQTANLTGGRYLAMAAITANIPPGGAWLPDFFSLMRERGLGGEIVACADTGSYTDPTSGHACWNLSDDQIRSHVRAIATTIAQFGRDLPLTVEIANENAHPSQSRSLQNTVFLKELRDIVKSIAPWVPVSYGSTCCGQPDTVPPYGTDADYVTLHLDRERQPDWDEVRRVKDLIDMQIQINHLIADDEGMGSDEQPIPGKRSTNPVRFFTQGVLDRLGELASTYHCQNGVTATPLGPIQQQCLQAYVDGATLVPDDQVYQFYNDTSGQASTDGAGDWSKVEKLFTFINLTGGDSLLVALKVTGDFKPKMKNGWNIASLLAERQAADEAKIQIFTLSR